MHFACFLAPGFHMPVALTGMPHSLLLVDILYRHGGACVTAGMRSSNSLPLLSLELFVVFNPSFLKLIEYIVEVTLLIGDINFN